MKLLFELGQLVQTKAVSELMENDTSFAYFAGTCLGRHIQGDWGELCDEDRFLNDVALANGDDRLFSSYTKEGQPKLWIITEWDRSVTTLLFPEDY